ncbi:MAG: phosphoribosylformylglycinamidine synthase subunit PurQ [Candidatus Methanoplasma sp.]|jgi:phosphoribosylformylglycinamidine synthase|nr:phosphoribosylformylglycinamidine synthase subunit PurQ [Candidatus Methanoplasma sp.]
MSEVRVCVLRIEGTNCEDEMAEAFRMCGAAPEKVHLNQMSGKAPPELRRSIEDYDILALPGGFSAGDYVRAGAIFGARIKSSMGRQLRDFVDSEKPVFGVCNGFQILVELGLLPAAKETMEPSPTAALYNNDSGRFECRPTILRNDSRGRCRLVSQVPSGRTLAIPSAHAEGRLLGMDEDFADRLEDNDQVVFRYVGPEGEKAGYPWNPNGSKSDIAGICNPAGNVLGMMPHPERVMTRFTHADWTRGYTSEDGDGKEIIMSVVKAVKS